MTYSRNNSTQSQLNFVNKQCFLHDEDVLRHVNVQEREMVGVEERERNLSDTLFLTDVNCQTFSS